MVEIHKLMSCTRSARDMDKEFPRDVKLQSDLTRDASKVRARKA